MKRLDLDDAVVKYIKSAVALPADLDMGRQDSHGPGIVYVLKATNKVTRYYGGRTKSAYAFTIMTKLEKWRDAVGLLNEIDDALRRAGRTDIKSINDSFQFVKATATDTAAFREAIKDDDKDSNAQVYSIYAQPFEVTVIIN
ncbi:hypothetical protein [Lacticaseibacillus suilingensis]|uniref:hypothetical protein n=1 Tax=Lacticaseibacillus suilingensis TaxID=2799577 RepID=UPI0022E65A79|nr:hypothetical protein [Lacticaseibacillus suilingensis]